MIDSLNSRPMTAAIVRRRRVVGPNRSSRRPISWRIPSGRPRSARVRGRAPPSGAVSAPTSSRCFNSLDDKQRVAFRVSRDESGQHRRSITADPGLDHVADVIGREPMEGDSSRSVFSPQRLHEVSKLG